ncbi:MAG TPA: response regulator, partial [Usitatibacteraceae bacterium]|nr:response regulator [Usitatibacteraceae bacterium]
MEAATAPSPPAAEEPGTAVILVVEDDAAMRRMIQEVLSAAPAKVVAVESSQAALEYLEREAVAVVLTDLRMPRVSGLEVLRFARARSALTQVILLTGHATVEAAV